MNEKRQKDWFEMPEVRRRKLASSVWIPLRKSEVLDAGGTQHHLGSWEEVDCVGSVAFPPEHRQLGEKLGWSDIGLSHAAAPFAHEGLPYKPADVYWYNDGEPVGIDLVLVQRLNSDHPAEWMVSQDLVMALGLLREADRWVRVDEGYVEVMRQRRDKGGRVVAIEIKAEFLRDYLAARGLALRIAQYRCRKAIVEDASGLGWGARPVEVVDERGRFSTRAFGVDAHGMAVLGDVAVMRVWRTDVDHDQDVPVMAKENDNNTDYERFTVKRPGPSAYQVEGELWREEWIEPAAQSLRVRGDKPTEDPLYVVDASGETMPASALNNEDIGRWLWFRPELINALLGYRGAELSWYSRDTGAIKCSPDFDTHFGINAGGFVNVYANDVARLPLWQQRIWAGFNASPNGPVSKELMSSQMAAAPAGTAAPEHRLSEELQRLDALFEKQHAAPLFRAHSDRATLLKSIHRFRSLASGGVLALAKDIARAIADSLDIALLRSIVKPKEDQKLGSLKLLQAALTLKVGEADARAIMGPLVGIYDLRLADAHPASSSLADAYALVGIDLNEPPIGQAVRMLEQAADALGKIHDILAK